MRVVVTPDYRTLSRQAAEFVADAVRSRPNLTLALPAGNTPTGMYEELVQLHRTEHLDFAQATTFNLDEYVGLAKDDPRTFREYMRRTLFDHVNIDPGNIHFPDETYEETIAKSGGIDLLILGIGRNGHIAFNEPGSSFATRTRVVELAPETIAPVRKGITMGVATILEARRILLLASGVNKHEILKQAIHGPVSESVPATALQSHSDVIAIVDEAAYKFPE
jgi:glucosamine-6-phosphate deaminase